MTKETNKIPPDASRECVYGEYAQTCANGARFDRQGPSMRGKVGQALP